ncbi:MAG TPA: VCBS repeat-containing protein, partial [Candidatus Polarisedimenticolia bacterium]|nr:VCBS repeat-containing protein [Candidatus Polarisedimenticolia bacterium]
MAALLDRLVRGADPMDNPFLSAERAEATRIALKTMTEPQQRLEWEGKLATELLNAGKTEEAIQELLRLKEYMAQQGMQAGPKARHFLSRYLAIAYLRLGEQQNCIFNHSAESCLLPIRAGGVHKLQLGSRSAIEVLKQTLKDDPSDLESRWFLNLAYMTLGEYPSEVPPEWVIPPKVFDSAYEVKRFADIAGRLGLDVDDLAGGSIVDDFDGDGDLDILASAQRFRGQLRYFRDNGDGTFTDRTREAGLIGEIGGLNLVSTDYNNDGWVDAMVLRGGWMGKGGIYPFSLLRNNGDGTFADVTEEAGLLRFGPTQSATWFDYDGDGWLDVYVAKESTPGTVVHPCELFHNNRDGTFTECAAASGLAVTGLVKAVASGDYNNDGRPDVYISRMGDPNLLFRNDGPKGSASSSQCPWTFTDVSAAAGVTEPIYSFPAWFFDYDNDGWLDIFVSGYQFRGPADVLSDYLGLPYNAERPRLYHNNHDGTFGDVTRAAGLFHVVQTMGSNFGDLDNDGWLDIYLGTGDPNLGSLIPNRMFRNAEGKFFQDVTTAAGVGHLQKGHAVSFADFDGDGDQDIYEVMGGAYEGDHYRNAL